MPDPITHRQYLNWLDHPVTRRLHQELKELRQEVLETLGDIHRGKDEVPGDDRLRGVIYGFDQVLGWEVGEGEGKE